MDWVAIALPLLRGLALAAVASGFGTALFRLAVAPAALRAAPEIVAADAAVRLVALLRASLAAALVLALLWLPAQAAEMAGRASLAGALAATPVVLFETHFGAALLWRLGALVAALAATALPHRPAAALAALAATAAALGLQAEMGHAAASDAPALPIAEILHVLAAGAWLGGLLPLLLLLGSVSGAAAAIAARRFSLIGILAVVVLVCSASVQGEALIGGMAGLFGTPYGETALAKLGLFLLLLLAAAINRFELTPNLDGPTAAAEYRRRLRASVMVELALGLVLVLVAATLATEAPAVHEMPRWPFRLVPEWRLLPHAGGMARECLVAGAALGALGIVAAGWQRFRRRGAMLAAIALCALGATQVRLHALPNLIRGTGTVIAADRASRLLVVDGDAIPGFMAAMTMPYAVARPALLDQVHPDERVEFDIDPKTLTITAIRAAAKPR